MINDSTIWLQHYDSGVPAALDYPQAPLYTFLEAAASRFPGNTALSYLGNTIDYASLDALVNRAANALVELGVKPEERVALYLANTPQYVIGLYAVLKIGAIAVPINPLYRAEEVLYELNDSGAKTLIVMSRFYPLAEQIRAQTALKNVIVTNVKAYFPWMKRLLFTLFKEKEDRVTMAPGDYELEALMERQEPKRPDIAVSAENTALLQYTSGTTGRPKGVMLSHYNLVVNALQCKKWVVDTAEGGERVLGWLPFFHSFGMTACLGFTLSCAGTLVLIPNPRDLEYILTTIEKEKITMLPGVPTMYAALGHYVGIEKYDLGSIRACICGGAPLMEEVKQRFVELTGSKLVEGYGLSEAAPVTHANPINGVNKPGSIGIPMPDTHAMVVDLERGDEEVPVGEAGELVVKGPQVMQGYWRQPELTADAIRDGWLYTGDVVVMDEEGYFRVIDRKKEIIIVKGLNVSPTEVERVICSHPDVEEAAVIGIPDAYRGETIKAFVVPRTGSKPEAEALLAYLEERLARFKLPRTIAFVGTLPRNVMGKLLRRRLREEELSSRQDPVHRSGGV